MTLMRVAVIGSIGVLCFDAVAALASRSLGFNYVWASPGSMVIYLVLGFLAGGIGGTPAAATVGLIVGLIDATIGETISAAIGPVRTPPLSQALQYRALVAVEVVVLAVIISCAGAALQRWSLREG